MKVIDKKSMAEFLHGYISQLTVDEIESIIELPPPEINYTYAFPCFRLAKFEKKAAEVIK